MPKLSVLLRFFIVGLGKSRAIAKKFYWVDNSSKIPPNLLAFIFFFAYTYILIIESTKQISEIINV